MPGDLPPNAPPTTVAASLFWAYHKAKVAWGRFVGKPVGKVRGFIRQHDQNGKAEETATGSLSEVSRSSPAGTDSKRFRHHSIVSATLTFFAADHSSREPSSSSQGSPLKAPARSRTMRLRE